MPVEFNANRVEFYPSDDYAYALYTDRVIAVLSTWHEKEIASINDCIEVYECKRTIETHSHLFPESQLKALLQCSRILFSCACKKAASLLDSMGLEGLYDSIELQYCDRFWGFIAISELYKSIDDQALVTLLGKNPHAFGYVVRQEPIVKAFDFQITEAFKENPRYAAELIIGCFGSNRSDDNAIVLPKSLTSEVIDRVMLAYLDGGDANLNYVRVLEKWPRAAHNIYNPSPVVRVNAKKASSRLTTELFKNGSSVSVSHGLGVVISPEQKPCKGIFIENGNYTLSYSAEWLAEFTDSGTVLNNFIHVFDFVNSFGLLMAPANKHEEGSIFEILGMHARDEYPQSSSFNMRNMQVMAIVLSYRRFLLGIGTRLEEAIEWFFNDYIEDEFGIAGFSISLPTEETSLFDKCKSIGPEIERVSKAFQVYVEHGKVDGDYFRYTRIKQFKSLPSLLQKKYAVEGERLSQYGQALFSNQSVLAHCSSYRDSDSFFAAITAHQVTTSDYHERYGVFLEDLVDKGFISIRDGCIIEATLKMKLLQRVWQYGALPMYRLTKEYETIVDELVSDNCLQFCESLFTPDEADYMDFMFNDASFSNSMAIRNKYDHADGSVINLNSQETEQDYCYLLALLIFLVLKINEELSVYTGKGGIEDFVDWPLVDEDMLNEAISCLPKVKSEL